MDLKTRIEKVLSEVLSDKHECKVTLHFEKQNPDHSERSQPR